MMLYTAGDDEKFSLASEVFQLKATRTYIEDTVYIDDNLGRDTEFVFDYSGDGLHVNITTPS